jgi:hypothetical protein
MLRTIKELINGKVNFPDAQPKDTYRVIVRLRPNFGGNSARTVDIPNNELAQCMNVQQILDRVWYYGQNDFQRKPVRSLMVGDIVILKNETCWQVSNMGFDNITDIFIN